MTIGNQDQGKTEVLHFIGRYWKWLVLTAILAGTVSLIATSFMTPKYTSSATVFPPGFNSADRMLENPQFGYNIEADRLIQMGESSSLKDSIIDYFDLYSYYQIDSSNLDWKATLLSRYNKDIQLSRTKYMSVRINAQTKDPKLSAKIVNRIIEILDRTWERLFKNSMGEALRFAENAYFDKNKEVIAILDSIQNLQKTHTRASLEKLKGQMTQKEREITTHAQTLNELRESGKFHDFRHEMNTLNEEILEGQRIASIEKGKMEHLKGIEGKSKKDSAYLLAKGRYEGAVQHQKLMETKRSELQNLSSSHELAAEKLDLAWTQFHSLQQQYESLLNTYEPHISTMAYDHLRARYEAERDLLKEAKRKYEMARRYFQQPLPGLFVIEPPTASYRKSSPSYFFNFLISVCGSLLFMTIFLLIRERVADLRKTNHA